MNRSSASKAKSQPSGQHGPLRIGDVAAQAGVNQQTLRYYERRGILRPPKRSDAGYREYPIDTVRLIRFIKRAQDLGFTLTEIEELITLRQTSTRRRNQVRTLAAAKMKDIDEKLARLQAMRSALYTLVEDCACGGAETLVCPILEALDDAAETVDQPTPGGTDVDH